MVRKSGAGLRVNTVYVRGDKKLTLGDFLQVVSALDEAKLKQMVVTKPEDRVK